jgi:hypothetical protein
VIGVDCARIIEEFTFLYKIRLTIPQIGGLRKLLVQVDELELGADDKRAEEALDALGNQGQFLGDSEQWGF